MEPLDNTFAKTLERRFYSDKPFAAKSLKGHVSATLIRHRQAFIF
jgi:hypothetical protein